ncbi:hypothetical protein, partial [Salmonella sp. s55004]|uniref:hypothetical protein n=1 Tax=Salmonella sp. s55004 TaxID=3159675 RepID=UPI00397FC819
MYNITGTGDNYDLSSYSDPLKQLRTRPSEEYFERNMLQKSDSINETGYVIWQLALCLLLAWIIVFLCLIKGIKSSGKVVYVTAT